MEIGAALSVWMEPESNGGAWTRLFFASLSSARYPHLHMERRRGLEPGWSPGTLGRGSSEPLVRLVVQGTSLGHIMELCRMDDVTQSISGEGEKKGEKSV